MKLLIIDGGHGQETSGKRTPALPGSKVIRENTFNDAVVAKLQAMAIATGEFKVVIVSGETTDTPLATRTARANAALTDWIKAGNSKDDVILISIHYNGLNGLFDGKKGGVEVLTYEASGDSLKLGQALYTEILKGTPQIGRGIKARPDLHMLRESKMLAALIEYGFMDQAIEAELMDDDWFQTECATETLNGLLNFFGISIVPEWIKILRATLDKPDDWINWIKEQTGLGKYLPQLIVKVSADKQ